ncbi:MAG TPA: PIG-L family deacetylase [Caldimonas sp.]|nr:PIG-L family deacetylase [Caldimonas sp.]
MRLAGTLAVISPHLDDGVFACGELLAAHPGSVVVTVFAAPPADPSQATDWDARCGFATAGQALAARRSEDLRALALLGARPRWLRFCDSQYGATPACEEVATSIAAALEEEHADTVFYPLGLFHSDHRLVHEASRAALARRPAAHAYAYEDALYRALPGLLQERLAALLAEGVAATPVEPPSGGMNAAAKAQAVRAYASQLRAFGLDGYDDTRAPERCWRLDVGRPEIPIAS